jgi:hypothetical protein
MQLLGLGVAPLLAVLAVASVLTIALYLLRLRRRRVAVPFIPLWESLISERQSSRLFSRLKHVLSLLLALAIVALLTFALGDPRLRAELASTRHVVVLVDAGVTMRATDVKPDRLHVALDRAREIVRAAGPNLRVLVAQMDASTTPLTTLGAEHRELERALDQIQATDLPTDYARAYRFALDVLRGRSRPEVVLLSDAPATPDAELAQAITRAGIRVSFAAIGRRGDDVGITQFAVRRYPLDKNRGELLLELTSASKHREDVELTLLGDGAPIDVQHIAIEPGQSTRRVYDDVTGVSRTLEARIRVAGDHDDLAADDRAFTVLPEKRRSRVLCVSEGDRYLEAALLLDEYLDVDMITPAAYRSADGYDAVIFERFVPDAPPSAPAFYIAPGGTGAAQPLEVAGTLERPFFDKLDREHPIMRFIALHDVNIARAQQLRPEAGDRVLGGDARGPLLVAGERNGRRFAVLGFDVRDSDLPLRVAWPLLLINVIDWFTSNASEHDATASVGETVAFALPAGIASARVRSPAGDERTLVASDGRIVLAPSLAGFHQVTWDGGERLVAVNLAASTRRDLTPLRHLVVAPVTAQPPEIEAAALSRPPWVLLLALALLLVTVEWWTYHRRWTI